MSKTSDLVCRLGRVIRQRRSELGITQEQLAARSKINRSYVGDIERGARNLSLRNIERLAAALDLPVDVLLRRALGRNK